MQSSGSLRPAPDWCNILVCNDSDTIAVFWRKLGLNLHMSDSGLNWIDCPLTAWLVSDF